MGNNKEYKKKWREENKERIKENYKEYYKKNSDQLKEYQKSYRKNNKDVVRQRRKDYYENNKELSLEKMKSYYENNKECITQYKKEWYDKNKNDVYEYQKRYRNENKDLIKDRHINKVSNDPVYALKIAIRKSICGAFKRGKFNKQNRTELIIGCTFDELKLYIESKFEPWMNWDNRGKYIKGEFNIGWDIDHVIPLNTAKTLDELIRLNHIRIYIRYVVM